MSIDYNNLVNTLKGAFAPFFHNHDDRYFTESETSNLVNNYHDSSKVDKVTGKGLSSNDFTNILKNKLDGLSNYDDTDVKSDIQDLQTGKQDVINDLSNIRSKSNSALQPTGTASQFLKADGSTDSNNYRDIYYCTCSTSASTSAKVISTDSDFTLQKGAIIAVRFSVSNTASNVTFNVNNTGAKQIYYNTTIYTGNSNGILGYTNRTTYYIYDGTYWVFITQGIVDNNTTYYPTISASHYSTETIRDNATSSSYNNIWSTTPTRSANYSTFTKTTSNVWSYCKSAPISIDDTVIIDFDYIHDNTNLTNKIFHFYGTDSSGAEKSSSVINGNNLGLTKNAHITIVTNNKGIGYYVDGRAVTWVSYERPVTQYFRFGVNGSNVTLSFKNYKQRKVNNIELSEVIDSKQNTLVSGTNIKTINNESILGNGNLVISGSEQIQSDYAQTDNTQVDFIRNKPDIRQLVIDVLNEKLDGAVADVTVGNGKLITTKYNSGDFDD